MSHIAIDHAHQLPPAKARAVIEEVAAKLQERFGVDHHWDGDLLHFTRSGVDGHIALQPGNVHVTATLGFLLGALKGPIENEIRRVLDERFA